MMVYEGPESAGENFDKLISQLQRKTKALVKKLERIKINK